MTSNLWRKQKWAHIGKKYPDVSCKDAPVPPTLPVPTCDCGKRAVVLQSLHKDTAGRAYYLCSDYREWEMCYFFQWIDGPDMYNQRILQVKRFSQYPKLFDKFVRWVPPPPNPPKLTDKEKWQLKSIRVADPPLCNCGKRNVFCEPSGGSPYFRCEGMTRDPLYGPDGLWKDEVKGKRVIESCAPRKCPCGVNANHGIVPSELGVGYYCGHVVGNDMGTRKYSWEEYLDKGAVDHEIAWRSKRPPNVLSSYLENRKKETRDYYRALYPPIRSTTMAGTDVSATEVEIETMKALVGNLPVVIPDDDDDEVLYDGLDD